MRIGRTLTTGLIQGMRFGRLTAIRIVSRQPKYSKSGKLSTMKTMVEFKCDCGNTALVSWADAKSLHTRSCGCLNTDSIVARSTKHGHARRVKKSPEWITWIQMVSRCYRTTSKSYERYGGRGITVCDRWRGEDGFANFLADMGPRPEKHTIERIDNNAGYCPDNCRWADVIEQANNKRNNVRVAYGDQEHTVAEWGRIYGVKPTPRHYRRIQAGWNIDDTFRRPSRIHKSDMRRAA